MLGLRVEQRSLDRQLIARDIAEHIRTSLIWNAAVVAEQPAQMHAAIRKELQRITQSADPALADSPTRSLQFSSDTLDHSLDARITVATAEAYLTAPPMCRTIYVTCVLDRITLHRITSFMPPQALVVLYEEPTSL